MTVSEYYCMLLLKQQHAVAWCIEKLFWKEHAESCCCLPVSVAHYQLVQAITCLVFYDTENPYSISNEPEHVNAVALILQIKDVHSG